MQVAGGAGELVLVRRGGCGAAVQEDLVTEATDHCT